MRRLRSWRILHAQLSMMKAAAHSMVLLDYTRSRAVSLKVTLMVVLMSQCHSKNHKHLGMMIQSRYLKRAAASKGRKVGLQTMRNHLIRKTEATIKR